MRRSRNRTAWRRKMSRLSAHCSTHLAMCLMDRQLSIVSRRTDVCCETIGRPILGHSDVWFDPDAVMTPDHSIRRKLEKMKRVAVLTTFVHLWEAFSLCNVVEAQVRMLLRNGYDTTFVGCEGFEPRGIYKNPLLRQWRIPGFHL